MADLEKAVTHSQRLRRLAEHIRFERSCTVGGTGYIDDHVHPEARATKGKDKHGRVFITLCLRSLARDDRSQQAMAGVITVFQRYAPGDESEHIVTQASNTWRAPKLLLCGAATDADMELIERLVMWSEASRTVEGLIGGRLQERFWLIAPEEAMAAERQHHSRRAE